MGSDAMPRIIPTHTAVDLLDQAASMLQFIADVSPAIAHDDKHDGITASGAFGLGLIFDHINKTIGQARELI